MARGVMATEFSSGSPLLHRYACETGAGESKLARLEVFQSLGKTWEGHQEMTNVNVCQKHWWDWPSRD